jgi:GNAT superfamily N-acetyltransferase
MLFRGAVESDIEPVMTIIRQAQEALKGQGVDQWQNGYPNVSVIRHDIAHQYSYVLEEGGQVAAVAAVSFDGERTYDKIYEGKWLSDDTYAVIHRMAVGNAYKGRGLAACLISHIEDLCLSRGVTSVRVDTHEDNLPMQSALRKSGFQLCGVIYLDDKSKRLAFEKILKK